MDFRQMLYFEAVYRLRSFSRAAEELALTHSALTKGIKTLEENWNTQLFHRTTRSVTPTQAGKRLYPMAVRLLAFAEDTKRSAIGAAPVLSIITHPVIQENALAGAIAGFRKIHPNTKIVVDALPPLMAMEELLNRRVHLLMFHTSTIRSLPQVSQLKLRVMSRDPTVIAFRPGHPIEGRAMTNSDLVSFDWAVPGFKARHRADIPPELQNVMSMEGFPKYDLSSVTACIDLTMRSDVLTALPQSFADRYEGDDRIRFAPPDTELYLEYCGATLVDSDTGTVSDEFLDCFEKSREDALPSLSEA